MHLQLITLHGVRVDQDIYELIAPTAAGEIAIFPGHEPVVTLAVPGVLAVRHEKNTPDQELEYFAISGGILEISQKAIRVLVDEADHGDNIIEAESQAALDRALKLRDEAKDQVELEKASQLIDRHQVRLQVADLQRRRRR
jgi:F-type H+-transporting ATPase subunit epsilon